MFVKRLENDPNVYSKRVSKIPAARFGEPKDIVKAMISTLFTDISFP